MQRYTLTISAPDYVTVEEIRRAVVIVATQTAGLGVFAVCGLRVEKIKAPIDRTDTPARPRHHIWIEVASRISDGEFARQLYAQAQEIEPWSEASVENALARAWYGASADLGISSAPHQLPLPLDIRAQR